MKNPQSIPKVRPQSSLLKNMLPFGNDPIAFVENNRKEYGDVFNVNFPLIDFIVITHCFHVKHVLVDNQKNYTKGRSYDFLKMAIGNGLITNEGDSWLTNRRLSQPAFHKKELENFVQLIVKETRGLINTLKTSADKNEVVDLSEHMNEITLNVISKILFSTELGDDRQVIMDAVTVGNRYVAYRLQNLLRPPVWVPTKKNLEFKKALKQGDEILFKLIKSRRTEDKTYNDLLSMLLHAKDEESGETMDDQQLRDEMITLLIAGFETSANALTWGIWELFKNPEVVVKLREELNSKADFENMEFSELFSLPYTNMVINECLRMYPPAWSISRNALDEDNLNGFEIKKGNQLMFHIYAIQRNEEYWADPNSFDPERFNPENIKKIPKHAFMPFGAGPRFCIGSNLAMLEMIVILSMLVKEFDVEVIKEQKIEFESLVTNRPKYGMKIKLKSVSK
jgi:cytochrome P450